MPSLDDLKPDGKFMGLFLGSSGSGKKVAGGSFPRPIKFIDMDGRIRGLQGADFLDLKGMGDVEIVPSKPKDKNDLVFEKVNKILELMQGQCNTGMCPYKTLYLGSMTGMAFAFLQDANLLTHQQGGMKIGPLNMTGPQDYKFELNACKQTLGFLKFINTHPTGIPNIIISAHTIPKWGKPGMEEENLEKQEGKTKEYVQKINEEFQYLNNVPIGEKLSMTDRLGAEVPAYFDHVFKFEKEMMLGNVQPQHFVTFRSELAKTSFAKLPNGRINITGKLFYPEMMRLAGFGNVSS